MSENGGRIVATIEPDPHGDKPLFRIVRRHDRYDVGPNVRPCEHGNFTLDERWSTVTCGKCHTQVDAFAALMRYAEWWEDMQRRRGMMEDAEQRLLVESLRRYRRLRDTTEEEVAEINKAVDGWPRPSLEDMRALDRRLEEAHWERKRERKRERKADRG